MLKREAIKTNGHTKITFILPNDPAKPKISVVGNFNDWNPVAHQMVKRANNTRSVTVSLPANQRYVFRYYTADGTWFNDDAADGYEQNEYGTENCIIVT
jgi:1,4-alpha-glucan branching enzyme